MKFIFVFTFFLACFAARSQDTIITHKGEFIKAKIIEIGVTEIKFKLHNDPSGPTISIEKSTIKTLKVGGQTIIDVKAGMKEDIIVKKDGSIIKVKILDLGTNEVKMKLYNNPDGPTISLKKDEIKTITIDGQVVYEYKEDPFSTSNNLILDKNSSLKFHFFSPLNSHIAFTYEWMNKPGFNWELGAGVIGPGIVRSNGITNRNPKGAFLRFGPKFLLGSSSDIEIEGARYSHPLKGRYLKVEMMLHAMNTTHTADTGSYPWVGKATYRKRYQSVVMNLIYGRQFIFGNSITVSWYLGAGYSFESITDIGKPSNINYWWNDFEPRRYSHMYFGENFPMTMTFGFTVGYILKTPEFMSKPLSANRPSPKQEYPVNRK